MLHFVGFIDNRYWKQEPAYIRAVKIFGEPDFIHRVWDMRAYKEIVKGDKVIWHNKSSMAMPPHTYHSHSTTADKISSSTAGKKE